MLAMLVEHLLEGLAELAGLILVTQGDQLFDFLRVCYFRDRVNLVAVD